MQTCTAVAAPSSPRPVAMGAMRNWVHCCLARRAAASKYASNLRSCSQTALVTPHDEERTSFYHV